LVIQIIQTQQNLRLSNAATLTSLRCKSGTWSGTQGPLYRSQPAQEPTLTYAQAKPYGGKQTHIIDVRVDRVCVQHGIGATAGGHS